MLVRRVSELTCLPQKSNTDSDIIKVHLSKLMSSEFEKAEVRVNSIAPGYFPSEMTMKESDDSNKTHMPAEKVQEKGHVPANRPGSDEEMAQAVIFLCKNMYVNGELIAVDGGALNQLPS